LCKGKGEQSWRIKCCKIGVETCSWNPDGYPLCIQLSSMKV
jgi:hypothetical protein